MGLTFDDIEVRLGERVLEGASNQDISIRSLGMARKPSSRIEALTLILNDERADAVRVIGVGGVCRLFGGVDGDSVRQSAKIEAIEATPEGGVKASFVWATDRIGQE